MLRLPFNSTLVRISAKIAELKLANRVTSLPAYTVAVSTQVSVLCMLDWLYVYMLDLILNVTQGQQLVTDREVTGTEACLDIKLVMVTCPALLFSISSCSKQPFPHSENTGSLLLAWLSLKTLSRLWRLRVRDTGNDKACNAPEQRLLLLLPNLNLILICRSYIYLVIYMFVFKPLIILGSCSKKQFWCQTSVNVRLFEW